MKDTIDKHELTDKQIAACKDVEKAFKKARKLGTIISCETRFDTRLPFRIFRSRGSFRSTLSRGSYSLLQS